MKTDSAITIRDQIRKDFGVDLPILDGNGQSIDDPIVIDPNYKDWSEVEYSYIKLVNQGLNRSWRIIKQTLLEHNGRKIDQLKLKVDGDEKNIYNYYFDVTKHV